MNTLLYMLLMSRGSHASKHCSWSRRESPEHVQIWTEEEQEAPLQQQASQLSAASLFDEAETESEAASMGHSRPGSATALAMRPMSPMAPMAPMAQVPAR